MKIVISQRYGGFGLSKKAYDFMKVEHDNGDNMMGSLGIVIPKEDFSDYEKRTDERLVKCVESLGHEADSQFASLTVIEIPDNSFWVIDEYDGFETLYYSESEINRV